MSRFKCVIRYRDIPLAELARSKLESEGIECFLLDKYLIGINWLYSEALGGVKVHVKTEDAKQAEKILAEDESPLLNHRDLDFPELEQNDFCDSCGSSNLELIKYSRISGALMLLHLPLFFWGTRYKCKDCGKKKKN